MSLEFRDFVRELDSAPEAETASTYLESLARRAKIDWQALPDWMIDLMDAHLDESSAWIKGKLARRIQTMPPTFHLDDFY